MVFEIVLKSVLKIAKFYEKYLDSRIVEYITAWWMNRKQEPSVEELENLLSFFLMDFSGNVVLLDDLVESNVFEIDEMDESESEEWGVNIKNRSIKLSF